MSHSCRLRSGHLCIAAAMTALAGPAAYAQTSAADAPRPARHHFSLKNAGETFERIEEASEVKLTAEQSDGRFSILDEHWEPGFMVPPHFHKEHAELFYVLDGQVEWTVGGETHLMGAGSAVYIPPDTVHSVKVVGDKGYHGLMFYEPGGYEYNIYRENEYTKEQQRQPEIQAKLRKLSDFNPYAGAVARRSAGKDDAPRPALQHFSLKGAGPTFDRTEVISEIKVSALQTDGRFSLLDEYWRPGFVVQPHFHAEHAEVFYIIDGEVEWTVGGETHRMGAGSMVYIPPDTVHSVKVLGDRDVHTLMLYEPGGYEYNIEREFEYTKEQQKQPEIQKKLREMSDFNPVQGE